MAATAGGRRLTETHRQAQARLGAVSIARMFAAWALLDPSDLDGTTARWLRVVVPLIEAQHVVSTRLASNYMRAFRAVELGSLDGFAPQRAVFDPAPVVTSLTVTGPGSLRANSAKGVPLDRAIDIAKASSARAGMRHVLNGGRDSITDTISADPRAQGWYRATSGNACHFCAMLASRGAVYIDVRTALGGRDSGEWKVHDGCHCEPEPIYRDDSRMPPGSERYRALWDETTAGLKGNDAINAFRRAIDAA